MTRFLHLVKVLISSVGSIIVHPYEDSSLPALELGASIFVGANKNLWRASDEFNLTRRNADEGGGTGVWDGEELILSVGVLSLQIWRQCFDQRLDFSSVMDGGIQSKYYGVMASFLLDGRSQCAQYFLYQNFSDAVCTVSMP